MLTFNNPPFQVMIYLNENNIEELQESWSTYADIIQRAACLQSTGQFHQPLKPYLRFGNAIDRIIAMPAYLGGDFKTSGLKWIASFPGNLKNGLPRAHSVVILNNPSSGVPLAILESSLISGIRTASVSASVLTNYVKHRKKPQYTIGISGFGPIAKLHIKMLFEILKGQITKIKVFDINSNLNSRELDSRIEFCTSWNEAYTDADIFITCTSSSKAYINKLPKNGSLHLNVSLRDYKPEVISKSEHIIVDDWDEVCRENTDIFHTHQQFGLKKEKTISLSSFFNDEYLSKIDLGSNFISFNPMGMAIFDMAVANRFYSQALKMGIGIDLNTLKSSKVDNSISVH